MSTRAVVIGRLAALENDAERLVEALFQLLKRTLELLAELLEFLDPSYQIIVLTATTRRHGRTRCFRRTTGGFTWTARLSFLRRAGGNTGSLGLAALATAPAFAPQPLENFHRFWHITPTATRSLVR